MFAQYKTRVCDQIDLSSEARIVYQITNIVKVAEETKFSNHYVNCSAPSILPPRPTAPPPPHFFRSLALANNQAICPDAENTIER